ncbi:MAG: Rieske 2Fe-2S domain-containing protein, partial [Burkholderiaceae bacterium]
MGIAAEWGYWHPVWRADRLSPGELVTTVLLNEQVVLWRDLDQGLIHAAVDRCPHRGAALSLGRIEG